MTAERVFRLLVACVLLAQVFSLPQKLRLTPREFKAFQSVLGSSRPVSITSAIPVTSFSDKNPSKFVQLPGNLGVSKPGPPTPANVIHVDEQQKSSFLSNFGRGSRKGQTFQVSDFQSNAQQREIVHIPATLRHNSHQSIQIPQHSQHNVHQSHTVVQQPQFAFNPVQTSFEHHQQVSQQPQIIQQQPHISQQQPHIPQQQPHIPQQQPHIPQQQPHILQQQPHISQQQPHILQQQPHIPQRQSIVIHQTSNIIHPQTVHNREHELSHQVHPTIETIQISAEDNFQTPKLQYGFKPLYSSGSHATQPVTHVSHSFSEGSKDLSILPITSSLHDAEDISLDLTITGKDQNLIASADLTDSSISAEFGPSQLGLSKPQGENLFRHHVPKSLIPTSGGSPSKNAVGKFQKSKEGSVENSPVVVRSIGNSQKVTQNQIVQTVAEPPTKIQLDNSHRSAVLTSSILVGDGSSDKRETVPQFKNINQNIIRPLADTSSTAAKVSSLFPNKSVVIPKIPNIQLPLQPQQKPQIPAKSESRQQKAVSNPVGQDLPIEIQRLLQSVSKQIPTSGTGSGPRIVKVQLPASVTSPDQLASLFGGGSTIQSTGLNLSPQLSSTGLNLSPQLSSTGLNLPPQLSSLSSGVSTAQRGKSGVKIQKRPTISSLSGSPFSGLPASALSALGGAFGGGASGGGQPQIIVKTLELDASDADPSSDAFKKALAQATKEARTELGVSSGEELGVAGPELAKLFGRRRRKRQLFGGEDTSTAQELGSGLSTGLGLFDELNDDDQDDDNDDFN